MVDKILLEKIVVKLKANISSQYNESYLIEALEELMASIPQKRRASFGIVSVVALLCKTLFKALGDESFELGLLVYEKSHDFRAITVGLGLLSHYGIKHPLHALIIIKKASDHNQWEVREFVQMFIRKITKENKEFVQDFLIDMTKSDNPNHRRFASEALRPVVENKWIHDDPDYSTKVLRNLFKEPHEFPRVSVANNLSDLSRNNPELTYTIVEELISLNNSDSDFIAYRACGNLVKEDPIRVMNLLNADTYKYKGKNYSRDDYDTFF